MHLHAKLECVLLFLAAWSPPTLALTFSSVALTSASRVPCTSAFIVAPIQHGVMLTKSGLASEDPRVLPRCCGPRMSSLNADERAAWLKTQRVPPPPMVPLGDQSGSASMSPTLPPPPPVPPHQPMPPAQQRPASGRARILPTRQPEEVQVAPARKLPRTSQRASVGISSSPIKRSPPVSRLPRDGTAEPPSQTPAGSGLDSRPTTSDIRARDQGRKRLNSDANGTLPDPSAWAEAGAEERFGVETPMPGRERQYAAFKSLNARGGYGGMGASASVSKKHAIE